MKKLLLSTLAITLLATITTTTAFSQTNDLAFHMPAQFPDVSTLGAGNEISAKMTKVNVVNNKIKTAFDKSFAGAADANWFAFDNNKNVLAVFFNYNSKYSRAAYTKNGKMLYSVIQASEELLSKDDRRVVKSNYVDYGITNVAEVTSGGNTVWIVNLQSEDNVIILRLANDTFNEIANYPTAKNKK